MPINKYYMQKKLLILLIAIFCVVLGVRVDAASKVSVGKKANTIQKIFYFKDNQNARTSLFSHSSVIDILSPQVHSIDGTGTLTGNISPDILTFAQNHKIKIMPLVTNKGFSPSVANAILDDQLKQNIAINALVAEAEQNKYWGWQMDFEQMDASYRDRYSAFIAKINNAFKEHNLILSIAVIAQISENPADYPKNLWQRIIGVYDYGTLADNSDFISVMSYDDPKSKGPTAPYPWLKKVLAHSLSLIPADKLSLGIPLYYWDWNNTSGKLISVGGYTGIKNVLKKYHTVSGYSTTNQAPYIKYSIKKNHYQLWYENGKSITQKINLIKKYKLKGFSAWVLGLEAPSVYSALK